MAHLITLEIGEGYTHDCTVCPFSKSDSEDIITCGLPENFPDCENVNYAEMQVINN